MESAFSQFDTPPRSHQTSLAMACLEKFPLDKLDPLTHVTRAVANGTLLSNHHITNPKAGDVYVFKRGGRWGDEMKWPFTTRRWARKVESRPDYEIYHGVDAHHLSDMIRAICTIKLGQEQYGVAYYLSHTPTHDFFTDAIHLRNLLVRFFQNDMQKVHSVIQSVLQKRRDRDAQVQNAGNATVEVATRDDSKIDDSRQVAARDDSKIDDSRQTVVANKGSLSFILEGSSGVTR